MTAKPDRSQLGDLLVEMGLVDREQLALALAYQRTNGGRLGRILAERKVVDEDRLAKAIAARLGLEAVNLSSLKIHERVLALIPSGVALKYGALPIAIKRTNQAEFVYVVMADPLDSEALAELARVSGREIRVLVATATELDRALEQHYRPTVVRGPPPEVLAPAMAREKSAQIVAPPSQTAPAGQPPPPQKSDVPNQKRGLPPPSASQTGPQPPVRRPVQPSPSQVGLQTPVPAQSPSPAQSSSLPPRMELPRAKTGTSPLPQTQTTPVGPPPMPAAGLRSPFAPPEKKPTLPPLPARSPGGVQVPPLRPEISRSGQTPLPPQSSPPALPRSIPPPAQTGSRGTPPVPASIPRAAQPQVPSTPSSSVRSTPSQGTALPPLRPMQQTRDTAHDFFGDSKRTPMPLQAPRVPTSEEDKTGIDLDFDRPSLSDELKVPAVSGGDVENTLGEWDRAVRDWPRNVSSPSISTQTLPPESTPIVRSPLAEPVAPQVVVDAPIGALVIEPVTTESSLKELGVNLEEVPLAVASDVPTSIPQPAVVEEVQVEILEIAESGDDIKTSQVELTEDYEMMILRSSMSDAAEGLSVPKPEKAKEALASKARLREQYALEIPVDISDAPNPFDGPENVDIPVGLERTGIIPAIDWENEEFVPPPLSKQPVQPLLAGSDDIPTSAAAARARSESFEPAEAGITSDDISGEVVQRPEPRFDTLLEARAAAQEIEDSPRKRRSDPPSPTPLLLVDRVEDLPSKAPVEEEASAAGEEHLAPADDSDSSEMPVIEPSSLVSLMDDDGASKIQDTGADQAPILHADSNGALALPPLPPAPPAPPAPTLLFDEKDRQMSPVKSARQPREPGEEDTNPRLDGSSVRAALTSSTLVDEPLALEKIEDPTPPRDTVDRDRVLDDLEGMFIAAPKVAETPRPVAPASTADDDDALKLVEALAGGDSLTSSERAQLVLAIGRLLLEKGVITKDELAAELRK